MCLDIESNKLRYSLCNIYAPNDDHPQFFKDAFTLLEQFENHSKIIAGDMNLVMNLKLDKKGGAPITHFKSRDILETYIKETDMVDIWRLLHPEVFHFTWKRLRPEPIFCRLPRKTQLKESLP